MFKKDRRIVGGLRALAIHPKASVVSIGVFDGVHMGHQTLIRKAIACAKRHRLPCIVVTFDPDPQDVLQPGTSPNALMPLAVRCRLIRRLGADWVVVIRFNRTFARLSAQSFVEKILIRRLSAKWVIVGDNFRFGQKAEGDVELLKRLGLPHGMRVNPVKMVKRKGLPVSSSRIRRLVREGKLSEARGLVGRAPELFGEVVRGAGRGRRLGTPTANVALHPQTVPPQGVYVVRMHTAQGVWGGVMNYGTRPTFCPDGAVVCEVHLFNYSGNLYGKRVVVSLLQYLRPERFFDDTDALRRQISKDIRRAGRILAQTI